MRSKAVVTTAVGRKALRTFKVRLQLYLFIACLFMRQGKKMREQMHRQLVGALVADTCLLALTNMAQMWTGRCT